MANFIRVISWTSFLLLVALGFWLVHLYRNDDAVSTAALAAIGCAPIVFGFVLAWGELALADRLDSRPCPRCGHRVRIGAYRCPTCGYDFAPTGGTVPVS
jgi:ribosomal protein L40E